MNQHTARAGPATIVALDFADAQAALSFAESLSPGECRLKVGFELFTAAGPAVVRELVARGFDVFLDLKFHDIPNTVARACRQAAGLGVWMLNVHALGGQRMMRRAVEGLADLPRRPLLIAVTVLTSHTEDELQQAGLAGSLRDNVLRLATSARAAGLDGVVCSALEAQWLRAELGEDFKLVTPGIRPEGAAQDDQRRIVTPRQAREWGSDYLVVGRPVTGAADPLAMVQLIRQQLGEI